MAVERLDTSRDLTTELANAAAGWDLKRDDHISRAAKVRADNLDQSARMIFETEERRKAVLGRMFASSEQEAMNHETKAEAYRQRSLAARERGLFLDDGTPEHVAAHPDLHGAAVRAGRVLHRLAEPTPPIFSDTAPDAHYEAVEQRFREIHGFPRQGFIAAVRQRMAEDAEAKRQGIESGRLGPDPAMRR